MRAGVPGRRCAARPRVPAGLVPGWSGRGDHPLRGHSQADCDDNAVIECSSGPLNFDHHRRFRLQTHLGNDWEGTVVGAFSPVLDCRRTACVVYLIPPLMGTVVNLTGTSKRLNKQDRVKVLS